MKTILLISPYWREEHRWMVSFCVEGKPSGFSFHGPSFPAMCGSVGGARETHHFANHFLSIV
jgi:hypothetical protein